MQTAFRSDERFDQQQFAQWLEEYGIWVRGRCELIGGEIVMTPPAGYPHAPIATRLNRILDTHVLRNRLGMVCDSSAGYELPSGDTLEPDVSFISNARREAGPKPERGKFFRIVPDLVIEILSVSTERRDRSEKKSLYASNGVDEYWLVDSERREVTIFVRRESDFDAGTSFRAGRVRSQVLAGLSVDVSELFDELD